MRFITSLASFLAASVVLASPVPMYDVSAVEARQDDGTGIDTCEVKVPCIVQYEADIALTATNSAVAVVKVAATGAVKPAAPVVQSLSDALTTFQKISADIQTGLGPLSASEQAQLQAAITASAGVVISQVNSNVALIVSLGGQNTAFIAPEITAAAQAVVNIIVAIGTLLGCKF